MENNSNKKLILFSKYGYVLIDQNEYINEKKSVSFSNIQNTMNGTILKTKLIDKISIRIKTIDSKRKILQFTLDPNDKILKIFTLIAENDPTNSISPSSHRLIFSRGKIKDLTISRKVYEERLEPNQLLLLAPRQPIRFHDTYHGSQIAYEDDGIGIRKIYGEDVEIALVDKAVSHDSFFAEFLLETEPDERGILIGISLSRHDYYVDDYTGFWGLILSDAKLVSSNEQRNYGKTFKIGDKVGISIVFNEKNKVDVEFYQNGVSLGVAFENLEKNVYYPAVILYYEGTRVKIVDNSLKPEMKS